MAAELYTVMRQKWRLQSLSCIHTALYATRSSNLCEKRYSRCLSYFHRRTYFVTTVRYYADVEYRLSLNYRGFFFYYLFIAVGYAIGMALYGISHSWVSIFILGEMFGLLFVTITGSIFKKPFFKKSQFFREDAKTCVSLSSAYLLSDFVTYTDRVVLPMTAGDAAS